MALSQGPTRTVKIPPGHLGITLSNHSLGCKVDAANPADAVYAAGLRRGDVITHVDGIGVSHHETACDLLGSNIAKKVVMTTHSITHTVTFLSAAAAADIERSRSLPAVLLGLLTGAAPAAVAGGTDGAQPPASTNQAGQSQALPRHPSSMIPSTAALGILLAAGLAMALYKPAPTAQARTEEMFATHGIDEELGGMDEALAGLSSLSEEMSSWADLAAAMEQEGAWDHLEGELPLADKMPMGGEAEGGAGGRGGPDSQANVFDDGWVNEPDL